jgi:hypothetical protein
MIGLGLGMLLGMAGFCLRLKPLKLAAFKELFCLLQKS